MPSARQWGRHWISVYYPGQYYDETWFNILLQFQGLVEEVPEYVDPPCREDL